MSPIVARQPLEFGGKELINQKDSSGFRVDVLGRKSNYIWGGGKNGIEVFSLRDHERK